MPLLVNYDPEQNVLFADAIGLVSIDDIMSYYAEVERMDMNSQYSVLADFSQADTNLSYDDVFNMVSRRRSMSREAGLMKIAVVAKTDLVFGITRIYEAMLNDECFKVGAFRDRAKALEWLGIHEKHAV